MTCAHTRGRTPCAPILPPLEPDVGDVVYLKCAPDKPYVVTGYICERVTPLVQNPAVGDPAAIVFTRFRVKCNDGFSRYEHEVGICELVEPAKPEPLMIVDPPIDLPVAEEEDVLDFLAAPSSDPFATIEQATIQNGPTTPDDTPPAEPTIEWKADGAGFESACGRFNIQSQFRNCETSYFAIDNHANTIDLRLSPDGDATAAKAWCERRARYRVIFSGGEEQLAPIGDLDGIEF